MQNNWAIITPVEQKEVEKQGFSELQNDKICCGDCQKPLISVMKVQENNTTTAIRVVCPYCDDISFWYKVTGKIYMQAEPGLYVDDAPIDIKNDILYSTMIVKKE